MAAGRDYNMPARKQMTSMSDEQFRPTQAVSATCRTALAAVLSAILFLVFTPTVVAANTESGKATPVRLQLKWRHQFQFAGFYTALEKGYYREVGLAVTIIPATPGTDPVETVLKGGAEFGVASSELVLRYAKGDPVVVLASIFQHSPLALFVRRDAGIETVHDLAGHKVALAPWETEIFAYLQREHVPVDQLQLVQHDYSVDTLVQGRVDALAGYETDESYYLQQTGGSTASSRLAPAAWTSTVTRCSPHAKWLLRTRNGPRHSAPRVCEAGSTRSRIRRRLPHSFTRSTHPTFLWRNCALRQTACCRWCARIS